MSSYQLKNLINIKEIKKEMDSLKSHREKKKRLSELIKAVNSKINEYKLNDDSIPTLYSSIKSLISLMFFTSPVISISTLFFPNIRPIVTFF